MSRFISRAQLARWVNVARSTAGRACAGPLYDATTEEGVDVEHPLVIEWLDRHGMHKIPPPGDEPDIAPAKRKKSQRKPTRLSTAAPKPPPERPPVHDLEHLEHLTVREVVMRYGSVDGFKRFVDILKSISEFKYKELRAKQQRRDLVDREKVAGLVFPLIDVAFSRLVTDVPESVSKLVIARVESGGPDTGTDVQKIIRDANSRVLKNVKQSAINLEILSDAN